MSSTTAAVSTVRTGRPSRKLATIVSLVAVPVAPRRLRPRRRTVVLLRLLRHHGQPHQQLGHRDRRPDRRRQQHRRLHRHQPQARLHRHPGASWCPRPARCRRRSSCNGTGAATTKALASDIALTVTQGTGGSFGSCTGYTPLTTGASVYTGTLAGFASTASSFATGVGTWNTAGATAANPETRTYQLTYSVRTETTNDTQGGTAAIGFTWEAQNS